MTRIVILGAGTAGTIMANRLRRLYSREIADGQIAITVVDESGQHVYQPGLLFFPFGMYSSEQIVRPAEPLVHQDVRRIQGRIDRVEPAESTVYLADARALRYDVLIIATGARIAPEKTEGLTGAGWGERIFDFYTLEGATRLREALDRFDGGRLVVNVVGMPIKSPLAPLEFAFLADWYFSRRRIRKQIEIAYVTPLDGAYTTSVTSWMLANILDEKRVKLVTDFSTARVDGDAGVLYSGDGREVPFDLLVTVPLHAGTEYVGRSPGLGDEMGFVRTDPFTLRAEAAPNIFAIGDATNLPAVKVGSVANFEAEVLAENVRRFIGGEPLDPGFDGHAHCFVETGFRKALLLDFNYELEPLMGTFPLPHLGPMTLLEETRSNHLAKLAVRWLYWNMLLPGHGIPGIGARMSLSGKELPVGG